MDKAVVLHSGGLDSTAALLWARLTFDEVTALFIDYGQSDEDEKLVKKQWEKLGVSGTIVRTSLYYQLKVQSSLTNTGIKADDTREDGYGKAFIPNRNSLFAVIAHTHAVQNGINAVIFGVVKSGGVTEFENAMVDHHQTAFAPADFPDSTVSFLSRMNVLLNEGANSPIEFVMPFGSITKHEMLSEFPKSDLEFLIKTTTSCNEAEGITEHEWGWGCGECEKCKNRQKIISSLPA